MGTWTELLKMGGKVGGKILESGKAAAPHVWQAAKIAYPHAKDAVKTTVHIAKNTVEFASKHKTATVVGTAVVLPKLGHKEGLLNFAKNKVLGEGDSKKGLVDTASTLLLGEQKDIDGREKSTAGKLLDTAFGDGTYNTLRNGVSGVGNEGVDLYYRAKNTIGGIGNEVGNLYQNGKQFAGGLFTGNGMVANGDGTYSDPSTAQYPNMSQMGLQQGNGVMSGLLGGMNNAVNTVSGGNVSKMNLAGLLLSAYMMFGRFGWLGKAASVMLGGMTLKNINNHQQQGTLLQQGNQQQQNNGQNNAASAYQQQLKTLEMQADNDADVVVRSRSL